MPSNSVRRAMSTVSECWHTVSAHDIGQYRTRDSSAVAEPFQGAVPIHGDGDRDAEVLGQAGQPAQV